jgi:uncharacterized membrane protein (UPF0127 family)
MATIGLFVGAGCDKPVAPAQAQATNTPAGRPQPKLPTIKLWLGPQEIVAEVAHLPQQLQTGMMFRTNITDAEGMLFVLPYTQQASFWMKNCVVPLSIGYIDPEGTIQEIHDLEPGNTNSVFSASPNIRFALEVSRGWFSRNKVSTGMVVRTERGSLTETFFERR